MTMIPVLDHKNLYRDSNSKAIINIDNNKELSDYRIKKAQILKERDELDTLKTDMKEIKIMLQQLMEK
jgi:hypothetical protein